MFESPSDHAPQVGDPTPIICEITPRTEQLLYREGIRIQSLTGFFRLQDKTCQATVHKAQKIRVTGYLMWDDASLGNDFEESARPGFLRYYPAHCLIAWQPQGTFDDLMVDQIADWLVGIEKASLPLKRFVDLSQLTSVEVRTRHVFEFARKRAQQFTGVKLVRTALFSDDWVCHAIARLYESLMEDTLIDARAFRDLAWAAEWLGIPVDVLTLKDKPAPAES